MSKPRDIWERVSVEDWRVRWKLPQLMVLDETASTNDVARTLADGGAPAGTLVMTEHQTAGRGSAGRQWLDRPGESLLMSFVLRPLTADGEVTAGTAPLRAGLAIARALRHAAGIDAMLKWPNDVVAPAAGKVAGILCEAASTGHDAVVVAGIGINVRQHADDWPPELRGSAVSIAQLTGAAPDRTAVMDAVIDAMRPLFTMPLVRLGDAELQAYAALDSLFGREVAVMPHSRAALHGIAAGIAPDGALLLDSSDGRQRITSATVRTVEQYTIA